MTELVIQRDVRLADHTTLAVGGPAAAFVEVSEPTGLVAALEFARSNGLPSVILGGGSNCLVADRGVEACVIKFSGGRVDVDDGGVRVVADAGVQWDDLVAFAVGEGRRGVEALSGIPGCVGAAPIQNIGAYGQELSDTLSEVQVVDRSTGERSIFRREDCGLAYRHSHFKDRWRDRYAVVRVVLNLPIGAAAPPRYGELAERLGEGPHDVAAVRAAVLALRCAKSMVYDPADPNHRSAGSFFVNPVIDEVERAALHQRLRAAGLDPAQLPAWQEPSGVKLSAAWLIERAGFAKGYGNAEAQLSSAHCLAITNRGSARASDLLELAVTVRQGVLRRFGVALRPEPVLLGFTSPERARLGLT